MTSLTYVAHISRRIIKYGGVGLGGLVAIWWIGGLMVKAYLAAHPPYIPPTVRFGILPKIVFPDKKFERKDKKEDYNIFKELKEGFNYAFGSQPIRAILLLLGIISLMGMSYAVLMPVFAKDVLGGGPHTLGFLMAAVGLGALAGTVYLASGKKAIVFGNTLPVSAGIFGIGITAFSFSHNMWISLFLLFIAGFGIMVQMASSNTILQTIVDDDKRGRVMSFYTMAFMGMAPLGSLLAGAMATKFGVASTLVISGICCIIAAVIFAMKRRVVLA